MQCLSSPSLPLGPGDASPEIEKLVLRWSSALRDDRLPLYEDVALGSLGTVADHLALARAEARDTFRLLRAGPAFEAEVGRGVSDTPCDDLAANYRVAFADCLRRASASRKPTTGLARCLVDGAVATCDLLALPLRNRWGDDLLLCYLRRRAAMHDLLDAIYRSTGDGLLALARVGEDPPDFQVVSLNAAAARLLGRPEDEIRWQVMSDLVPGWHEDALREELGRVLTAQRRREFGYEVRGANGGPTYLRVSVAPVGDLLGVALTDVTEMRRREESVRLLFAANPMPLLVYERASLRVRSVNDAAMRLCGRSAADLLASDWPDVFAAEERAALLSAARDASGAESPRRAWRLPVAGSGAALQVEVYANDLDVDGERCVIASLHDVTEQRLAEAKIAYLAHHDDLTGLCNRSLFRTSLAGSLALARDRGESLAVLCIDLDRFKQVNDTLGHGAGDQVLRGAGARIAAAIGPSDVAARLGGDEFAVIACGLSGPDEAAALAERIIARVAAPYAVEGHQALIGASIGLSMAPGDGSDPDILLGNADIALYRAKADGRGTFGFFEAGTDRSLVERRSLEADLRLALGLGEFELFFQPIVDAASLTILGFEALLRWFHPERGAVPPAEFIPIAEEIGVIHAIGDWVLRSACAEAARWPGGRRVAVNLSAAQFRRGDLPTAVALALAETRLDPKRLELEITESVFLNDSVANLDLLHRLRALGVSISLDDFGTGYSSLAYLNRFRFDKIKIDRSFIRDMAEDRHGLAIVRAVVSLGASLGLRTLAEGVETVAQLERLRAEGCTELQGFLLGRPVPAPRLPALLAQGVREPREAA